ncbi:MAG: Ppx/GppA family phosphatase [Alphaproteobacteria bacterium]|nr:Ppx/GppA family phosphatase [Alphaproteobacteria bacterium]MBV9555178.1 Ppx/GppA family phosphatase [Alphaproteobacteria bacterium]
MPDRHTAAPYNRIGVIDIGSNSLRLVVFERLGATLMPLLNEKVMCGLGRGIAKTGRLNRDGVELAYGNLQRFVALARALEVDHLTAIATAAVRDARDGEAFAAEIERQCALPVRIVDGAEEARLSAAGVLAGIPEADGIVGDLGGGSVELVRIRGGGHDTDGGGIGEGVSLPLGPLRLAELDDNPRLVLDAVRRGMQGARLLREAAGKPLFLVGGAWRAIARLHMEQARYPLHIIHQYTVPRRSAEAFLEIVAGMSRRSLERITTVNRKRLELLPLAALILHELIQAGQPDRIVFSAYGLREGYAYGLLPPQPDVDPLIAACIGVAVSQSRGRSDGDRLEAWAAPIFPEQPPRARRLHRAACWLSDIAWTEHPDYRAEQAFTRSLRMPIGAVSHQERVFIAQVLHARYGGAPDDPVKAATRPLLDDREAVQARALGLAMRLAYTLCGGALDLLGEVRLARGDKALTLELPPSGSLFQGEAVERRLGALGRALGLATQTVRRRARRPALA